MPSGPLPLVICTNSPTFGALRSRLNGVRQIAFARVADFLRAVCQAL